MPDKTSPVPSPAAAPMFAGALTHPAATADWMAVFHAVAIIAYPVSLGWIPSE
jgi:hypothetical protein